MSQKNVSTVETDNLHSRFIQALTETTAKMNDLVQKENGALTHASYDSALVDFHARATELRYADPASIEKAAAAAYDEDALLALKLFFQTGDVRGGKGERDVFNACMDYLTKQRGDVAVELLPLIPAYVRWDYLVRLILSENEQVSKEATRLVAGQFEEDVNALKAGKKAQISSLAKWMPSSQTKKPGDGQRARHLSKALCLNERDYLDALSALQEYVTASEKKNGTDAGKLGAMQQLRLSPFLKKVMAEKRHAYVQAVLRSEVKVNDSLLNPLAICHEYKKGDWQGNFEYNEDYEALWSLLPNEANGNTLVVSDASGSMTRRLGQGTKATMSEAAAALTLFFAAKLSGPFKDKFITFSSHPQLVNVEDCKNLAERLILMEKYNDCTNTDVEATFDLILDAAKSEGLTQDKLPSYLLFLSDMEFDVARGAGWNTENATPRETIFDNIRKKWKEAGYQAPTLVFWNLNGNHACQEIDAANNVIYLNGFCLAELPTIMAGEFEKLNDAATAEVTAAETTQDEGDASKTPSEKSVPSQREQLLARLSSERYDAVEEAVRGILQI